METLTLRYFNVFGPRMATTGAYATVIGAFLRASAAGKPLPIFGDGEQTRDFTHVRDVVHANLLAMDSAIADACAVNIGRGRSVSVNWIVERIGGPTEHLPARPGEPRHTLADCSNAQHILGWGARVSTEDGLEELKRFGGL